jgi:large subunit ribosomal protein L21
MSYAIIQTGGKQYKVKAGEILKIERLEDSKADTKIEFKEILAYGDDKTIEVGSPTVEGSKVEADLVENGKNRTILIFKKRRRQNSRRKNGHRQQYSLIRINKIFSKDGKILSQAEKMVKPTKKIEKVKVVAETKITTKKKEAKVVTKKAETKITTKKKEAKVVTKKAETKTASK